MSRRDREALAAIQAAAQADLFRISAPHATDVMEIYRMSRADLTFGLLDATSCSRQVNGRYDLRTVIDDRSWTLIVEIDDEVVIVTLFSADEDR